MKLKYKIVEMPNGKCFVKRRGIFGFYWYIENYLSDRYEFPSKEDAMKFIKIREETVLEKKIERLNKQLAKTSTEVFVSYDDSKGRLDIEFQEV